MSWPAPDQYNEVIQHPRTAFSDAELQSGRVELTRLGLPKVCSGAFAAVYRLRCQKRDLAVRCFLRQLKDRRERYEHISAFIHNDNFDCTVDFRFLDKGMRVGGEWYPILVMDWVDGINLNYYVESILDDEFALMKLSSEFKNIIMALELQGAAHGDLQHGNIIICDGKIRLVDYDGFFVPALEGEASHELGHPNYQHPGRQKQHFGASIDRFSAWIIYFSLMALQLDPELWQKLNGGDEKLLFGRSDYLQPHRSPALAALRTHYSQQIRQIGEIIVDLIETPFENLPSLDCNPAEELHRPTFKRFLRGLSSGVFLWWYKTHPVRLRKSVDGEQLRDDVDEENEAANIDEGDKRGDEDENDAAAPARRDAAWYEDSEWQKQAPKTISHKTSPAESFEPPASNKPQQVPIRQPSHKPQPSASNPQQAAIQHQSQKPQPDPNQPQPSALQPPPAAIKVNPPSADPSAPLFEQSPHLEAESLIDDYGKQIQRTQSNPNQSTSPVEIRNFLRTLPPFSRWEFMPAVEKAIRASNPDGDAMLRALNEERTSDWLKLLAGLAAYRCLLGLNEAERWTFALSTRLRQWFVTPEIDQADKRILFDQFIIAINNSTTLLTDENKVKVPWLARAYLLGLDSAMDFADTLGYTPLSFAYYLRLWWRLPNNSAELETHLLAMLSTRSLSLSMRVSAFQAAMELVSLYEERRRVTDAEDLRKRLRKSLDHIGGDTGVDPILRAELHKELCKEAKRTHLFK